jgi:hypothetical protein
METIIEFLATNKAAIGAIVSILEGFVVLINLWRKFAAKAKGEVDVMSASPSGFRAFLWAANPINLFRKPR